MIFKRTFNKIAACSNSCCTDYRTSSAVLSGKSLIFSKGAGSIGEGSISVMPYLLVVPQSYVNDIVISRTTQPY